MGASSAIKNSCEARCGGGARLQNLNHSGLLKRAEIKFERFERDGSIFGGHRVPDFQEGTTAVHIESGGIRESEQPELALPAGPKNSAGVFQGRLQFADLSRRVISQRPG